MTVISLAKVRFTNIKMPPNVPTYLPAQNRDSFTITAIQILKMWNKFSTLNDWPESWSRRYKIAKYYPSPVKFVQRKENWFLNTMYFLLIFKLLHFSELSSSHNQKVVIIECHGYDNNSQSFSSLIDHCVPGPSTSMNLENKYIFRKIC